MFYSLMKLSQFFSFITQILADYFLNGNKIVKLVYNLLVKFIKTSCSRAIYSNQIEWR